MITFLREISLISKYVCTPDALFAVQILDGFSVRLYLQSMKVGGMRIPDISDEEICAVMEI